MVEKHPEQTRSPEQIVPPFIKFAVEKKIYGGGIVHMLCYESTGAPVNLRDPLPEQKDDILLHPDYLTRYVRTETGIWEIGHENGVRYLNIPRFRDGDFRRLELGRLEEGTAQLGKVPNLTIVANEGIELPEQNKSVRELIIATTQQEEDIGASFSATMTMFEKPNYYHRLWKIDPFKYPI